MQKSEIGIPNTKLQLETIQKVPFAVSSELSDQLSEIIIESSFIINCPVVAGIIAKVSIIVLHRDG